MRIAFLCKRRYMSKDVILDRYARLYEIPYQLAKLGHDVRGFCLGYQGQEEGHWVHEASPGRLEWQARSLGKTIFPALATYPRWLLERLREYSPDIIIAASDIPHVVLGSWIASKLNVPWVADLYDNFEGFGQAKIPGMVGALRRAVGKADLVLTTSDLLCDMVRDVYSPRGEVISMPSSVDTSIFRPRDRTNSRALLGLPAQARLVGTAGGLSREKGIATLYEAWSLLREQHDDVHLVLAGPVEAATPLPVGDRVHYLGLLPHEQVAHLFSALDVGVMSILDTPFGRYCFPQKAYEMLACRLPVVAANVGAMPALFAGARECLFTSGDAADLAHRISGQLASARSLDIEIKDWKALIGSLEPTLQALVDRKTD
ncbi:glycosyltransferase family 4 protein [Dyella sp. C11]|uniref:glycosyltransferase family 4 protein n=1 Tax=Dyella sp. C11 TaxID=2126991 RepID=UPI000D6535E3|nr:glycosyltransferase family 4 protein [Dyella sp. C11]